MPLQYVLASFQPVHASCQPVSQPIPPAGTGQPQAGEPILYDRTRQQAVGGDKGAVEVVLLEENWSDLRDLNRALPAA